MGEEATAARYEPDPEFEEVKEEAMLDLSPTDSKEFWLIQWIKDKDFDVSDFHGEDTSLELRKDGRLGSLDSSSGKCFELVSYAYQKPNATVFLPSGSEMKAVGKISRRVCLVRHGEREGLKKLNSGSLTSSSKKSTAQPDPKVQLHNYAHRRGLQLPIYCPIQKGPHLKPPFKSKVVIDGLTFESPEEYPSRKAADRAAAQLALSSLPRPQAKSAGYSKRLAKYKKYAPRIQMKVSPSSRLPNTTRMRNEAMWGLRSIRQGL